jgi:hypothetical protein
VIRLSFQHAQLAGAKIYADPNSNAPTMTLRHVPRYAGMTALQAMNVGEAMHLWNFSFLGCL